MILGIFFARFLPQEGTKVVHQSPPGCIVPEANIDKARLFDFETLSEYIIPRQAFCNRYVTICDPENKYQILGHPVCIKDEKYERNEFMFNFCLVISAEVDKTSYETVVRRLASTFTEMETQTEFLSQEDVSNTQDRRSIATLMEIIKEDLNNYNECMIPVDDADTINMKLFPHRPHPPPIKSHHVPVSKTDFSTITDDTWDLTLLKVIPYIDGINDVRKIANHADVALDLAKSALQHLLYYDSILILDLFLFGNIYAPTPEINDFVDDKDGMQEECANYVYINGFRLANFYLCRLFTSLCTARTLKEWIKLHNDQGFDVIKYIDLRRFIQFGVIKDLIYRVHKYAVSESYLISLATGENRVLKSTHDPSGLIKFADGTHCFDRIYATKNMGDTKVMEQLRKFPKGELEIIYR